MTIRRTERDASAAEGPVQEAPPTVTESAPETRGYRSTGRRPTSAAIAADRPGPRSGGEFSAEAVPLRPAAERTAEREREERLRLMTARRLPGLPGLGILRPSARVAIAVVVVTLVALGSIAVAGLGGRSAGHAGDAADSIAARAPVRPSPVEGGSPGVPARHGVQAGIGPARIAAPPPSTAPDGNGSFRDRASEHVGRSGRKRSGHPRHPAEGSTAPAAAAAEQEPLPAPTPEPEAESTSPEPAPVAEPAPEPHPAPKPPPPPTSTANEEPGGTKEASTVERQFGFEE
jgi:hypothetical protein